MLTQMWKENGKIRNAFGFLMLLFKENWKVDIVLLKDRIIKQISH